MSLKVISCSCSSNGYVLNIWLSMCRGSWDDLVTAMWVWSLSGRRCSLKILRLGVQVQVESGSASSEKSIAKCLFWVCLVWRPPGEENSWKKNTWTDENITLFFCQWATNIAKNKSIRDQAVIQKVSFIDLLHCIFVNKTSVKNKIHIFWILCCTRLFDIFITQTFLAYTVQPHHQFLPPSRRCTVWKHFTSSLV